MTEVVKIGQSERVLYVLRACEVKRWHNETVLREQNVGNHSARVALWIILFHEAPSAALLKGAVMHDLEERVTGDIPHWAKAENHALKIAVAAVEAGVRRAYDLGFELTDEEHMWLNAADLFDAFIHIWQEVRVFYNSWMSADYERCSQKIYNMHKQDKFPGTMYDVFLHLRVMK
jgi:5'-deoxynucleotidase YfbR-like HD superfamily hydrolase